MQKRLERFAGESRQVASSVPSMVPSNGLLALAAAVVVDVVLLATVAPPTSCPCISADSPIEACRANQTPHRLAERLCVVTKGARGGGVFNIHLSRTRRALLTCAQCL